ncbi:MAG: NUDIX domain-containing protein [Coprobacillus sp.]|nr:NUDIX domain-containing protein [Coprobacillus sp.]
MQKYNLIIVYDKEYKHVLMCLREKEPFLGLYNFVGGKIESNETDQEAAYRELFEETHIYKQNIELKHVHDLFYYLEDMCLQVWVGQIKEDIEVYGDENQLAWINLDENFFDSSRFAGYGNIGHLLYSIDINKEKIIF